MQTNYGKRGSGGSGGIGLGGVIAALVSFWQWHSIWWALLHGLCGWGYLACWALGWTASKAL